MTLALGPHSHDVLDVDLLPGELREICGLIGLALTMRLVERYGGVLLYVPQARNFNAHPDHPLVQLLGLEAALKLAGRYNGALKIPRGVVALRALRDRAIEAAFVAGSSVRELALAHRLDLRTVERILAARGVAAQDRQGELFCPEGRMSCAKPSSCCCSPLRRAPMPRPNKS